MMRRRRLLLFLRFSRTRARMSMPIVGGQRGKKTFWFWRWMQIDCLSTWTLCRRRLLLSPFRSSVAAHHAPRGSAAGAKTFWRGMQMDRFSAWTLRCRRLLLLPFQSSAAAHHAPPSRRAAGANTFWKWKKIIVFGANYFNLFLFVPRVDQRIVGSSYL